MKSDLKICPLWVKSRLFATTLKMSAFGGKADITLTIFPALVGLFLCYSRAMTSDLDIYRAAKELIKQHGEDALIHAAMRADELLDAGDMDGLAVWKRILAAVEELQSKKLPEGAIVH